VTTVPGIDLEALATFAEHLADISHAMLRAAVDAPETEIKADRSFVTATDRAIEQRLRQEIAARYPDHGVIGEEEGRERPDAAIQWVLDPIDGTAPFIAGVPVYGTLISLAVEDVPVIGVMDMPAAGSRWVGVAGRPTTRNGQPCRARSGVTPEKAMMGCMNPDFFAGPDRSALAALQAATHWRIYGTSSLAYGLLASGRIDLCLDTRLQVHDFACYRPIIEGAGGVVTDWNGMPLTLASNGGVLASGSRALHDTACRLILA
jgi:inositol-phosphate phosphatase / L-galactose 1-phosphate phosphatase / histidinol-phosphatase